MTTREELKITAEKVHEIFEDIEDGRYYPCRGYWYSNRVHRYSNPMCRGVLTVLYKEMLYQEHDMDQFFDLEVVQFAMRNGFWRPPSVKEEDRVLLCREHAANLCES